MVVASKHRPQLGLKDRLVAGFCPSPPEPAHAIGHGAQLQSKHFI